jgi:hypothetical protein
MKFYVYISFLLLNCIGYGQEQFTITKGTKALGLSLNYNFQKEKTDGEPLNTITHTFLGIPLFGYAIKNNLILGAQVRYGTVRQTTDGSADERRFGPDLRENTAGLNLFLKKYIPLNTVLLFNVQGNISYETINQEDFNSSETTKANQFNIGLTPGLTLKLSNRLALTANFGFIGYTNTTTEEDANNFVSDTEENNFNINFNSSNLLIGLMYFIK